MKTDPAPTPHASAEQVGIDPQAPPKRSSVVLALAATGVLLIGVITLLAYRGATLREPGAAVVVRANEQWRSVELRVDGGKLPHPMPAQLDASNKYNVSFFLPPGTYTLHALSNGREVLSRTATLGEDHPEELIDLTHE